MAPVSRLSGVLGHIYIYINKYIYIYRYIYIYMNILPHSGRHLWAGSSHIMKPWTCPGSVTFHMTYVEHHLSAGHIWNHSCERGPIRCIVWHVLDIITTLDTAACWYQCHHHIAWCRRWCIPLWHRWSRSVPVTITVSITNQFHL